MRALHELARRDRHMFIRRRAFPDLNELNAEGQTALHISASMGHANVVRILVDKGANTALWYDGGPACYLAAREGHASVCRILADLPLSERYEYRTQLLCLNAAALGAHLEVIKVFERAQNWRFSFIKTLRLNGYGYPELFLKALLEGPSDILTALLASEQYRGDDTEERINLNFCHDTLPIKEPYGDVFLCHAAAHVENEEIVLMLLASGATARGINMALCFAMKGGHTSIAAALFAAGGGIISVETYVCFWEIPRSLGIAVHNGHFSIVELWLSVGNEISYSEYHLSTVAQRGDIYTVQLLLASGVDVQNVDTLGLSWAVRSLIMNAMLEAEEVPPPISERPVRPVLDHSMASGMTDATPVLSIEGASGVEAASPDRPESIPAEYHANADVSFGWQVVRYINLASYQVKGLDVFMDGFRAIMKPTAENFIVFASGLAQLTVMAGYTVLAVPAMSISLLYTGYTAGIYGVGMSIVWADIYASLMYGAMFASTPVAILSATTLFGFFAYRMHNNAGKIHKEYSDCEFAGGAHPLTAVVMHGVHYITDSPSHKMADEEHEFQAKALQLACMHNKLDVTLMGDDSSIN